MIKLIALITLFAIGPIPFNPRIRTVVASGSCSTLKDQNPGAVDTAVETRFNTYHATSFTAGSSYTLCRVDLWVARTGTPPGTWTIKIYNNNAGSPGTEVTGTASTAVNKSTFPGTAGWQSFTGMSYALTASTVYWVVIQQSDEGDSLNYVDWHYDNDGAGVWKDSTDGTTWGVVANRYGVFRTYSN